MVITEQIETFENYILVFITKNWIKKKSAMYKNQWPRSLDLTEAT